MVGKEGSLELPSSLESPLPAVETFLMLSKKHEALADGVVVDGDRSCSTLHGWGSVLPPEMDSILLRLLRTTTSSGTLLDGRTYIYIEELISSYKTVLREGTTITMVGKAMLMASNYEEIWPPKLAYSHEDESSKRRFL